MATLMLALLTAGALSAPIQPRKQRLAPTHPLQSRLGSDRARPPVLTASAPGDADGQLVGLKGPAADTPEKTKPVARLLGYAMTFGALGVFLPIIFRMLATGSAAGFSRLTWGMQIVGCAASGLQTMARVQPLHCPPSLPTPPCRYAAFMVYPVRSGYPLSSYVEYICLLAQSLTVNCLIRVYAGVSPLSVAAGALAFGGALGAALRGMPMPAAQLCAPIATGLLSASLIPQIARNFAAQSSGGWSAITAGLGVAGNVIRLYTTMQLAGGDRLLLAQFGIGTLLNAVMLGQVVVWGS